MRTRGRLAVVVFACLLAGCSLKGMREVPADQVNLTAPADQAIVVFLRAATNAAAASLFELRGSEQRFIGLLVDNTRLAYATAPGRTRFMVIAKSASFLDGELEAGKTYRVAVLLGQDSDEFIRLSPVRPGATKSEARAREHAGSIQTKKAQYLPRWESRPNRAMLAATDGR